MVTRFNEKTWKELEMYKREHRVDKPIFATPIRIKNNVPVKGDVFVFEMRNDLNEIMGISWIKNYIYADKYYPIYSDGNYNRYIYKGQYRISREDMSLDEIKIMNVFDALVFKGYDHVKRGQGIGRMPEKKCKGLKIGEKTLEECVKEMFIERGYLQI